MEGQNNKAVAPEEPQDMHSIHDLKEPQTPKNRTDLRSAQAIPSTQSPTKPSTPQWKATTAASSPITPLRGRARSLRKNSYAVEQRYSLSRNRSRGGVKRLDRQIPAQKSPTTTTSSPSQPMSSHWMQLRVYRRRINWLEKALPITS
jgi:hypothetical protein